MQNSLMLILIILIAVAFVMFLVVRNRRDQKKEFPPDAADDPVETEREKQESHRDRL